MVCGRHLASPILLRGCEIKSGGGVPVPRLDLPAYMPLPPTFQAHSEKTTLSDSNKILLYPHAIHWPPKHCCKHTASHNVFFVYVVRVSNFNTQVCAYDQGYTVAFAMWLKSALCVHAWLLVSHCTSTSVFTNNWAVEVRGGTKAADKLAQKHGFRNYGQVRYSRWYSVAAV